MSRRFAFVVPRFGREIGGGAETLVRNLALRLQAGGDRIEVLTTCATDNRTWENVLPPGTTEEEGITVHRFKVDSRNTDIWVPIQLSIADGLFPEIEKQLQWMENGVNSINLYSFLAGSGPRYDAIFLAPYLFGTTFFGGFVQPEKSFLIPCLHDESYAYLEIFRALFASVRGSLFNSVPEMELAGRLYGEQSGGEVGMGFDPIPDQYIANLPRFFDSGFPYILYLGRKETGKNVQILIDYFVQCKNSGIIPQALKLVLAGGGSFSDLNREEAGKREDIVDLSYVSEQQKHSLIRDAAFLVQPSRNESFSIVLMESWLISTPVVVDSACDTTRYHVTSSGGGLYYSGVKDFALICNELAQNQELARRLAQAGRKYVSERYNWEAVLKRFNSVLAECQALSLHCSN